MVWLRDDVHLPWHYLTARFSICKIELSNSTTRRSGDELRRNDKTYGA